MQRCPHSSAPEGAGCCIKALRLRSTRCQASPAAELNETDPSRGGGRLWSRFSRSIGSSQSTNKSLLIAAAGRTESASKCVRCMPLDGISEGYRCYTARDRAKVRAGKCKPPVRKKCRMLTASRHARLSFDNASKSASSNLLILLYLIDYKSSPKNS